MGILGQKVECLVIVLMLDTRDIGSMEKVLLLDTRDFGSRYGECLIIGHQSLIRGFSNYKTPETLNQRVVSI